VSVATPEHYLNADDKLTAAHMPGQVLAVFNRGPRGRIKRDVQCRADHPPAIVEVNRGNDVDVYCHAAGFTTITYHYGFTTARRAADREPGR